jgi:hypothetical protein
MKHRNTITALTLLIAALAASAAAAGVFSDGGTGPHEYESIRGQNVMVYGRGLYRDMSADVAPQGIAQDWVTLLLAVPLLLASLRSARRGSPRWRLALAGTLGYFFVTYLFYLMMAMYNELFLGYVALLATSFFALALTLLGFDTTRIRRVFRHSVPAKSAGGFLVFSASSIALLWLGIVVPPLLDGTVVPSQVEHYTTLVVQGLDLGLMLPLGLVSGVLILRERNAGYLLAPVYLVFLALLMTALTAKVVAMGLLGQNIVPVVFIIPTFNLAAAVLAALMLASADRVEA